MTFRLDVPDAVCRLVARLEEAGFETWTVGGAVRDALRGSPREREDWDLSTLATPDEVRRLFRRTVPLGVEYGTVGVFGHDGVLYEVTTFRHDVITFGRKAIVAFAGSLEEDLARRDFTVNAIGWHPMRRELRDPHGGQKDLRAGILRAVGVPSERFREDYLRVLRGLRFAGALGLEIDGDTWTGMVDGVPGLGGLSPERVREEVMKVLAGPKPSRALALYRRSGALGQILPELEHGLGREALATVDAVRKHHAALRMAVMLLFGMGPRARPAAVSRLLVRLRFSRAEAERIGTAMTGGPWPASWLLSDPGARRRWAARTGLDGLYDVFRVWLAVLRAGAARGKAGDPMRAIAEARRDLHAGVPLSVGDLAIAGRDLVARGWSPGPRIGLALRRLLEAVWQDPALNDRATLLEMAAAMGLPPGAT